MNQPNLPTFGDISMMRFNMLRDDRAEKVISDAEAKFTPQQKATSDAETELVNSAENAEATADLCRKITFLRPMNILAEKILANQEETMPYIIRRYMTSSQGRFIDNACLIFAYCDEKYVDEVLSNYKNIRNDFAKSEFCVVLGYRGRRDCIDFLKQELKNLNHEGLFEGPQSALDKLNER